MPRPLTAGDRVLIGVYILGIAGSVMLAGRLSSGGETAMVTVGDRAVMRLDLSVPDRITVHGEPASVEVEVADGGVRVVRADCPNKVCVRTGRISHVGEVILCAPNRVLIRVAGRGEAIPRGVTG